MRFKKSLAGAVLVLVVSGGAVAVAASMASANDVAPTAPHGPGIGAVGQTGDQPPAGVTVEKAQPAGRAE